MNTRPGYTPFHPRWYRRRVPLLWWLSSGSYTRFIVREFTCVFVGIFALGVLLGIRAVYQGPEAYAEFLGRMRSPFFLALNILGLLFVVYHSITWFHLAPKSMVVRFGDKRVPDSLVVAMHYLAWIVLSVAVTWILVGG